MKRQTIEILNTLSEIVLVTDHAMRVTFCNPAFCKIFGKAPEDWLGQMIDPGDYSDKVSDTSGRFESEVQQGPQKYWIEWEQSMLDEGDRVFVGRDITQRRGSEQSLLSALDSASKASEAKMRFLATMSHEMRTPLNGILGMTGLLLDSGLDSNQRAYADAVRESGSALLALINDILDFSKIEAGALDLEETAFDPKSLVQSVSELLSPRAAHKDLEIASYVDPSVPDRLIGDEARLRQVLLNLAGNGVKFTEDGGVTIEVYATRCDTPGRVEMRIDVCDSGVGISSAQQEVIFNEFAQADSTRARKFEGTGLGLAIARRIVQAMGGDITVTSEANAGSVFSFMVPLQVPAGRLKPEAIPPVTDHVVVVTTSPTLKKIISLQLKGAKVENFDIVDNAETALSLLRRRSNSVLLCDLPFAAQSGAKLAKAASHALVLLSPVARGRLEAFRRSGFQGYLIKPIRQVSLRDRLTDKTAAPRQTQRLDSMATAPAPGLNKLRILLAEDNQINAVLATAIIKRAGHHIDVAGNGKEALESMQNAPYHIVLMDMHMPEMDGLEATREIRKLPGDIGKTPIIALTANAMKSDRQNCLDAGMDDFITKPFDPADLVTLIEKWAAGTATAASEVSVQTG
ncbi:MAG: response regulator [Parvularculaceae bacterium]